MDYIELQKKWIELGEQMDDVEPGSDEEAKVLAQMHAIEDQVPVYVVDSWLD